MAKDLMCMHANRVARRHEAAGGSYPTTAITITIRGTASARLVLAATGGAIYSAAAPPAAAAERTRRR